MTQIKRQTACCSSSRQSRKLGVAPESVAVVGLSPGAESVPPREGGRERRPGHGPSVRFQWAYRTSACNAYISNETEYMAHVLGFAVHYGDKRS
jgi:hypothetical protein